MQAWICSKLKDFWSWMVQFFSWLTVIFGALTLEKVAIIIGIAASLGTFVLNWHFKRKHYALGESAVKQKNALCANCPAVQGDD